MSKAILKKGLGLRLAALAAVVAAVALMGAVFTQSADAADIPVDDATNAATAAPGDTVQLTVTAELAQATITSTADGVIASFTNGGQSIACADGLSCDKDATDDGSVRVDLTVDKDSSEGHILVEMKRLGIAAPSTVTKVITVSKVSLVGSLDIKAVSRTIAANDDDTTVATVASPDPNGTPITVNVKNAAATPAGMNDQSVTLITSLGSLSCDGSTFAQACSVTTANSSSTPGVDDGEAGWATVLLIGAGVEGVATVTATLSGLTDTETVTMFGAAKNLTAEPDQNSVEIGGSVYVVLTVTDDAGNPVSGQVISPITTGATKEVVGPEGVDNPVLVVTERDTAVRADFTDDAIGVGYSKDKPAAGSAAAIPACGEDNSDTDGETSGSQELFATEGTNDKGQCVVYVTAPADDAATTTVDETATRGAHTLNFEVAATPAPLKASAVITVSGAPDHITSDAPARIDPSQEVAITVTVLDDANERVGKVSIEAHKVSGSGLIIDEIAGETNDGQAKFTYLASSTPGVVEFLVRTKAADGSVTAKLAIHVEIGEIAPEVEEAPAVISMTLRAGGFLYAVTAEGPATTASALFGDAISSAWKYNQDTGVWDVVYIPGRSGNFSINTGDILYVSSPIDQTVGG